MTHNVYLTSNRLGDRQIAMDTASVNMNMEQDSVILGEFVLNVQKIIRQILILPPTYG